MLSAIKEIAESRPDECKAHMTTYTYLKAVNLMFEEGILSEKAVTTVSSPQLMNMKDGFKYFSEWKTNLITKMPGIYYYLLNAYC